MSASDARSISVTMSVPVVLVPTSSRDATAGPPAAAAPADAGDPLGEGAQLVGVGIAAIAPTLGSGRARSPRPRGPAQRHGHPTHAGDAPGDGRRRGGRRRLRRRPHRRPARGGLRRAGGQGGVAVRAVGHDGQPDRPAAARAGPARWCSWAAASTSWCARRRRPGATRAAQLVALDDADGTIDPAEVARWVADAGVGWAEPSAVFVEDTHGEVGGRVWPLERLDAVAAAGLPDAPRRRPPLERGGRVGHHRGGAGRARPPRSRAACRRAWARRSARCSPAPPT